MRDYYQDEKNQLLTTCMWFNLVWTDYQVRTGSLNIIMTATKLCPLP